MLPYVRAKFRKVTKIMKSTKVQTLGGIVTQILEYLD